MLFSLWATAPYRATGDLDLLGVWRERSQRDGRRVCGYPRHAR
jgi:hypothetical protein